ncbi:T9SS sorting signal type C domain-containing protein [Flavobacterium sp.]|uniref:T9SS sorting signal type C domain-containing protein n=1 Tax=Flavobacterium sp. TaxID=239 RepID=UPI00286B82B9|nr:T9SS sorting signal type C domain-containing protein [Flavobacterium sp.]
MKIKLLFIAIALFVGFGSSYGQGSENFLNIPTASPTNYLTRSWTGTNGVTWSATLARTDETLTGKAICTSGLGTVTSPTYAGGIGTLTFNYVRAFTGTSTRSIEVWVNGVQIGSTITVSTTSDVVVSYSQAINISGNIVLELRTSGAQIKIDDISWTGFVNTPTQLALVSVPTTGTTGTPVSSFTVEGRNAGNVLVPSFTGTVTLTKASGTGTMSGTLSANAVAGVATFNNVAFNQADTYTITAASAPLTSATTGNVVVTNPSTNIFGGDGVNFVGQINSYSQPINCTYGDYRVLKYRKVNTTASTPTDGRGQWVNTVNVQASGGDLTPLNMSGGGSSGFLFTSGGGCGSTGTYANKWAFGGVGQGTVDAINGTAYNGSTDMGFNMGTAGHYTFILKDNGYSGTGYYTGFTTNAPVTMTHNTGTQRTLNNDGTTTITATISTTNSSQENFYVRYKTASNDFSTGGSTISAVGSVAGTTVTFTIPVQADGAVVYYYIFSSTMSQAALTALSEGDKSYALLNYADNSGSNYTYTALSLTPTVTSIVPTAVTGVTVQANNTGFKGQTITINGTNFQSNSTVTINGVASTVTFISASQLTAVVANTGINFTGNVVVANPTPVTSVTVPSFNFLGYITSSAGDINNVLRWLGGSVPLANSTVTLAHNQTLAAVTTNTPFATMTILTGITMNINGASGALTVTGAITTVGTGILTFSAGGSATSGSIVNAGTISFVTGASNANLITGSINNSGTMSWTTAGTLTINAGGSLTNTGTVTSSTVGNVVFAGAGTINGATAITFNNLTINGTTTLTTIPTINGTLQLNSGSSVSATPTYGGSSTLIYNTTGTYGVSNEWTGNSTAAGSGVPNNVTIQNSTTLSMPNSNRGMAGSLNISSGNLTLNATSGDLYLAGNWTRVSTASFTQNNRAVIFNRSTSTSQIVTVTGGTLETFNYLTVAGSGTLSPATGTAINVTSSSGLSLSSTHASSTIDLNGQTLTLSGGGNLNLNGGNRFITSSATNGKFAITSNTITVTNGGTLTTSATNTTTVDLQNGLNCGTGSLVTINGKLQINANGFCIGNSPKYGASSTLQYNSNTIYNRQLEWTADIAAVGTIGLPTNVQISNTTTLNYINAGNSGPKGIAGNLTIDTGSIFYMDYGSVSSAGALTVSGNLISAGNMTLGFANGDDLKIGGNITFTSGYSFDTKNRAIFFTKTGTQIITASSTPTFNKILFTPASGTTTVQLASSPATSLNITTPTAGGDSIDFGTAANVFDINGSAGNTLTLGTAGRTNTVTGTNGTFKGSTTSNLTLYGTGSLGTLKFATDFNLGTFTMNREAILVGCTMGSAVTINTALTLTNGLIDLAANTMTLASTCSNTFGDSANSFVISDVTATGNLRKNITATGITYRFPVGDKTGTIEYSPATVNFTAGTFSSAYLGIAVEDYALSTGQHSSLFATTDYISRSWKLTTSGTLTSPTYTVTADYFNTDVNGTETNCVATQWNGTTWTDGGATGVNTLTFTGITTTPSTNYITKGRRDREINVRGIVGSNPSISDGDTTPQGTDNTLFAATTIGSSQAKDFRIENLGTDSLTITSISMIGGTASSDFVVSGITFPVTVNGGSSIDFTVTFSPSASGTRNTTLTIANNDSDESTYDFVIQGTGICPTTTNTITPTSGPVGTEITINATANNLTGATVTFNGVAATPVTYVSATQIKVFVPSGASSGNLVTTIATGCQATNAFTVIDNKANTCEGGNVASDLFISEVTDSNYGGLTYVEIYNGTGVSKSLSNYSINTASNGGAYSGSPLNLSNVTLAAGSTYTVALGDDDLCTTPYGNGSLAAQIISGLGINFDAYQLSPSKGNDHIALFNGATKIDSWGTFGDPSWATSSLPMFATQTDGATFRRKNTAPSLPSTTYSNADWNIIDYIGTTSADCANNDYSDIGVYNFISGTPPTVTTHPSYTPTCKATSLTVAGTEGYDLPGDIINLTYQWYVSAPNAVGWTQIITTTDGSIYTNFTSAILSISNISGVLNYQYYCQIRENTNTCYTATNAVKITDGGTATWNGAWTNGPPTLDKLVIINANYDTSLNGGDINACSIVVNSPATLTVTSRKFATIKNDLTVSLGGNLAVLDNGSLVMINDAGVVTNSGATDIYRKTSSYELYDYVYWSTPVTSTAINNTVGSTFEDWRTDFAYEFLPANFLDANDDGFDDDRNDWGTATTMVPGKGYIIRAPEPVPFVPGSRPEVDFSGQVNNGVVTTPIALTPGLPADDDWNLVGNPYPSAISANEFINTNFPNISGTLYFWTHKDDLGGGANLGPDAQNYAQDDYAIYNLSGGVATVATSGIASVSNSTVPLGYIASGQGFFIEADTNGSLIFNNAMRVGLPDTANSQFYKTTSKIEKLEVKDRIWLNMENSLGMFSQQLLGYFNNTTLGYDKGYDGLLSDGGNYINFYSFIDEATYKIQGRPAFKKNDAVRMGYSSAIAGTFNINIDHMDGVFLKKSTQILLEDRLLNVIYDLRKAPYSFTTEKGTFNDRFVLRYVNNFIKKETNFTTANHVLVSNKNKQIKVNSTLENINKIIVYDLLGRQIYTKEKINNKEFVLSNFASSEQTLLVKVVLENGEITTQKVVN